MNEPPNTVPVPCGDPDLMGSQTCLDRTWSQLGGGRKAAPFAIGAGVFAATYTVTW